MAPLQSPGSWGLLLYSPPATAATGSLGTAFLSIWGAPCSRWKAPSVQLAVMKADENGDDSLWSWLLPRAEEQAASASAASCLE